MKKHYSISFIILLFFICYQSGKAQDFNYSQFFNTPLLLNPALTGKIREDFRVGIAYRNQWRQINNTFSTTSISGEMNYRKGADKYGIGLLATNDQLGNGLYKNQYFMFSGAYHKTLDRLKRHKISGGLQIGYVHKNLTDNNLYFSSQIINYQISNSPSGENLQNFKSYININLGLNWEFVLNKKLNLSIGGATFNLNQPNESVLNNEKSKVDIRKTAYLVGTYNIIPTVAVLPAVQISKQGSLQDVCLGGAVSYSILSGKLKTGSGVLGAWYRLDDAFIPYVALKYKKYQFGMSYDFTSSDLENIKLAPSVGRTKSVGAIEFTFLYLGFLNRALPNDLTVPCRFF